MIHYDKNGKPTLCIEMNTLDTDFVTKFDQLSKKYGPEMQTMNNFSNKNLSFGDFIDAFIQAAVPSEVSPDANANSGVKDICTLERDMTKPHNKLLGFNKIYYELKKKYSKDTADIWIEDEWNGAEYMHDAPSATYRPYCFAYDLDKLVERGLYFVNKFGSGPAQHLTTFNDHVLEFVSWNCNRTSGAVGLVSYLVYSWWFWWKDVKNHFYLKNPEYYRRQCFQKFVYDCNQPYLRNSIESAFTNITIMDREYIAELFGGRQFPDGTFAIDHVDEILEHEKVFMDVVSSVRAEHMFTFPVLTYSLLFQNGKFVDEEFARWCSDHNCDWLDSNFYNGATVTSLSNCCFDGRQRVTIRVDKNVYEGPFKRMYQTFSRRDFVEVFYNGEWKKAKMTALKETHPCYKIITANGREIICTEDHIHLTVFGEKKTYNLHVGDILKVETNLCEKIEISDSGNDKIVSIERVDQEGEYVYCVELEDKEHPYFCLSNGIQTHNCRLISDTTKIDAFINSIGGTALSIGSVKVNTINLRRIALEAERDEDKYIEILTKRVDTCLKALDCVRHIISRNVEKGLLPNYNHELIEMNKQYNTIGITAMYEVMDEFGYIDTDEFGYKAYSEKAKAFAMRIMNHINAQKDSYNFGYSINVENVPKYFAGHRVA